MKKNYQKLFLVMLSVFIFMGNFVIGEAAEELKENSWRYCDGELIDISSHAAAFSISDYEAWSKTEEGFVNSNGEIIEGAVKKGIDVSKWNGDIDWEKVKNTDVDFVIIRCGFSIDKEAYDDIKWKRNADACTELGIPFGVYLYSYAENVEEAKSEAEHVLRLVEGYDLDYPIYYDMEDDSTISAGTKGLAEIAETFCGILEEHGYDVGVYANKYWWNTYLTDPVFDNWDKWVAQYNSECTYQGNYRLWQCTSTGAVDGIKGNVDINFEIDLSQSVKCTWEFKNISLSETDPEVGENIEIIPEVDWLTDGMESETLEYKYVWMKNNWKEWGVIQDFSEESSCSWVPLESGKYYLYVDIKDANGNKTTKSITVNVENGKWTCNGIETSLTSPQVVGKAIQLSPIVEGNTYGVQYKYVWMKDNWKSWGVIRNYSKEEFAAWTPESIGTYTLYMDVKGLDGKVSTYTKSFSVLDKEWKLNEVQFSCGQKATLGDTVQIQPQVECVNTDVSLQYKYVWMKNNWKEWGVIQDFSTQSTCEWKPEEAGEYKIYVDVKDSDGGKSTSQASVSVKQGIWNYQFVSVVKSAEGVVITPIVSGNTYGLQYKYVWMKDNWKDWGVIQDFSDAAWAEWKTDKTGTFKIYVDIRDKAGTKMTKIQEIVLE